MHKSKDARRGLSSRVVRGVREGASRVPTLATWSPRRHRSKLSPREKAVIAAKAGTQAVTPAATSRHSREGGNPRTSDALPNGTATKAHTELRTDAHASL